ncbi:MAG: zinc ribbon domain-containing protein [Clostridia bacterium]|nr:zinc ribbon domain-containing protein [Clostridia bacterium]
MAEDNKQKYCPSCGAPIVAEICAYCGTAPGLDTAKADMEYPVLDCKEATLSFWTVVFPMIFALAFGLPGLIMPVIGMSVGKGGMLALIGLPFLAIGIAAWVIVLRTVFRYIKVKKNGKVIRATVYGYMDDHVLINDRPAQVVKLLVQTQEGPRFVMYQLGNTMKPYGINDTVDIMVYRNYFMIVKNKEIGRF